MDRETLSNYGWIIIAIILISSFILFSSGFAEDITYKADKQAQRILLNKTKDSEEDLTLLYEVCETWKCGDNLNAHIMKDNKNENIKYKIYIKPIQISKDADYSMYDDSSKWKLINTSENIITPLGEEFGLEENQGIKESSVVFESLDFSSRITEIKPILSIWEDDETGNPTKHVEILKDYDIAGTVYNLKINNITLPSSVTKLSSSCFGYDMIQNSIDAPGVTVLEDRALIFNFNMKSANFNNLTTIGEKAFYDAQKLSSFYFADSITEIGKSAFENCSSFETVEINSKNIAIREMAFDYCENMTKFSVSYDVQNSDVILEDGLLVNCLNLKEIYLPSGTLTCADSLFNLTDWNITSDVTYYFNGSFEDWILFKEKNSITTTEDFNIIHL